jgi:hypothetical protein
MALVIKYIDNIWILERCSKFGTGICKLFIFHV